jgi:hypothetical protein
MMPEVRIRARLYGVQFELRRAGSAPLRRHSIPMAVASPWQLRLMGAKDQGSGNNGAAEAAALNEPAAFGRT